MPTVPTLAPLISARELAAQLGSPELLIVDCRHELSRPAWGEAEYRAAHIPGAVYAHLDTALSGPITATSGRHPLPTPDAFAATLASWGFLPTTRVVGYDAGNGAMAARLWWLLRARGHTAVQVLDGGLAGWRALGLPLDASIPQRECTNVEPRGFAGSVSTAEVAQGLAARSLRLVDARGADRFAGLNETIDPVAGHVPGALNHPFALNLGADGRFLDAADLGKRWQGVLEGRGGNTLVMMCGSGVTACHNLLALEMQGVTGAKLYAGSFSEWIRDPSRQVATGDGAGEAA